MRWEAGSEAVVSVNQQSHMLGLAALGWSLGHSLAPWPLRLQISICEMQIQECYLGVPFWTIVSQRPHIGGSSFHCRQNELSTLG